MGVWINMIHYNKGYMKYIPKNGQLPKRTWAQDSCALDFNR